MNAITHRQQPSIPALPPEEPRLSRALAGAVHAALNPVLGKGMFGDDDPGHRSPPPLLAAPEWEEAQRAADALDAMLHPVTPGIVAAWLMPINLAARNPQSTEQFELRARAIAELVADLPAAAFTAEARRKLGTGFFPSAQDVREAVEPVAGEWRRKRDALRGLRRAVASKPAAPDPIETPEEKASYAELNRATVEALKAEVAAREKAARPGGGKPQPNLLSVQARIAEYRRMGQHATAAAIAQHHGVEA